MSKSLNKSSKSLTYYSIDNLKLNNIKSNINSDINNDNNHDKSSVYYSAKSQLEDYKSVNNSSIKYDENIKKNNSFKIFKVIKEVNNKYKNKNKNDEKPKKYLDYNIHNINFKTFTKLLNKSNLRFKDLSHSEDTNKSNIDEDSSSLNSSNISNNINKLNKNYSNIRKISNISKNSNRSSDSNSNKSSNKEQNNVNKYDIYNDINKQIAKYSKLYDKIRYYISVKDYKKANELKNKINMKEVEKRQTKEKDKWLDIEDITEEVKNQFLDFDNYKINELNCMNNDDYVLANIYKDKGYFLIKKDNLEIKFIKEEFCGYVQYRPKE